MSPVDIFCMRFSTTIYFWTLIPSAFPNMDYTGFSLAPSMATLLNSIMFFKEKLKDSYDLDMEFLQLLMTKSDLKIAC